MTLFIALVLIALSVALAARVIREGVTGQVELLSLRNLFIAGFLLFQLVSGATSLMLNEYGDLWPARPAMTAIVFTMMSVVFLGLLAWSYNGGWVVARLARRRPVEVDIGPGAMVLLAFCMVVIGLLLNYLLVYVPVFGVLSGQLGAGVLAVACGLVAWAWAPRMLNPMMALAALTILAVVMGALLFQAFGRRTILGVLLAFAWGLYYGHWWRIGPGPALRRAAVIGSVVVVFMAIFSAARSGRERDRTIGETMAAMRSVGVDDIKYGMLSLFGGQMAAANSMWAIESYPESFEYDTLHTARYFAGHPIPRTWWPDKPDALGRMLVARGSIGQVADNYSVGPGIIGHCAADNPWFALPLYAIGLGLLLRLVDEKVRYNMANPFIVLPAGAALAQVLGLARGETGLFLFNGTAAMIGGWVALNMCGAVLASFGVFNRYRVEEQFAEDELADDEFAEDWSDEMAWSTVHEHV